MARTRKEYINELIQNAQENIWQRELAIAYKQKIGEGDLNVDAALHNNKRDEEYIAFLCESLESES
jgi:hypothetical protein